ncbi:MAG: 2-amino-4-hydroxy-6-hydroxymethyldihydropteridine diphosphokinase [Hyphomicrobiales bacterium]
MILIALGSNLNGPWGTPKQTLGHALKSLCACGIKESRCSRLFYSKPYGRKRQPPFVNAVARIETRLAPAALMRRLHDIEKAAGRKRRQRWGPRPLDIDLLAYHNIIVNSPNMRHWGKVRRHALTLPHPDLHRRPFVLAPLREIEPFWHHPITSRTPHQMLRAIILKGDGSIIGCEDV